MRAMTRHCALTGAFATAGVLKDGDTTGRDGYNGANTVDQAGQVRKPDTKSRREQDRHEQGRYERADGWIRKDRFERADRYRWVRKREKKNGIWEIGRAHV